MRIPSVLVALAGLASATVDWEKWQPPAPGDMRGPCPALNSLANHGILPHGGTGLTVPILVEALGALNVSKETATTVAMAGMRTSSDPGSGTFNLVDLKKHGIIEHDASLSRKDFNLGGRDQEFSPEIFNEFLSYFKGSKDITIAQAAAARWGRVNTEKGRDPNFSYGSDAMFNSYVESAIYHELLRNPTTRLASVDWIKVFFSQERLPFREGWRPVNAIDGFALASDVLELAMNTPEKAPGISARSPTFHGIRLQTR